MGRYLKNTELKGGSHTVRLPLSSSSVGPDVPVDGQVRFNTTVNRVEFFYLGVWRQVGITGTAPLVIDQFDGAQFDGSFSTTMSIPAADPKDIMVFTGGIYQIPVDHYTVSGTTLTMTSAPPLVDGVGNPNKTVVIHNLNSTDAIYPEEHI